jgi:non-ribosomal peptide synthetase component E (peptide arylation enzyme)
MADIYTDLLTFTFGGPKPYNPNQPLFIDAEDASRSFTAAQFRQLVRTLIAGLKAHNIQQGDCVLLHLGNSVSEKKEQNIRIFLLRNFIHLRSIKEKEMIR